MTLPTPVQRVASSLWPIALLILLVVVPFAVVKSHRELKENK